MRRIGRALLSALSALLLFLGYAFSALSLILLMTTIALWVRSYRVYDRLLMTGIPEERGISLERGGVVWVSFCEIPGQEMMDIRAYREPPRITYGADHPGAALLAKWMGPERSIYRRLGFGYISTTGPVGHQGPMLITAWRAPLWAIALIAAAGPVLWAMIRIKRWRRIGARECTECGYDLRATPHRCPECGTVPRT